VTSQRRELDIVVLGATGFTGALTAEYLAARGSGATRWAVAGRNRGKLEALRHRLGVDVQILDADIAGQASIPRLAEASRVVVTTVGPYLRYGEPVVAACAQAGTGDVDLTGEPEFVDRTCVGHHATAQRTGGPARPRLRVRLCPARPRRPVHGPAPATARADPRARVGQRGRVALWRHG